MIGTLEQIEVIQNGIQYEGMISIADCIRNNPNLKILNLNDNIMTPRGAIAIAKVCNIAIAMVWNMNNMCSFPNPNLFEFTVTVFYMHYAGST